jgi:hypothetical protein
MREISLSNSDEVFIVDDEDYLYLILLGNYCLNNNGYPQSTVRPIEFVHHIIARRMGLTDFEEIDHDDRNKLNASRKNLKPQSKSNNHVNSKVYKNSSSGEKYIVRYGLKWKVRIHRAELNIYLGSFATIAAAKSIRDRYLANHPEIYYRK